MFHVDLAHINAVGAIFSRSPLRLGIAAELFPEELADWPLVLLPNEPRDAVMRDDNWWNIVEFATYFLMKDVAPGMAPTKMAM
jgi:hypothetical protein